jgi:predicted Zn-dependent peptidase
MKSTLAAGLLIGAIGVVGTEAFGQERWRQNRPAPEPRPELKLPRIEAFTISNGLQVSAVYRESTPFISLHLIIEAGESVAPPQTPGLATLAAGMFGQGTMLRSAAELEEMIESMGGTFTAQADQDVILIGFHFLEEYLDPALDLLGEMILKPRIGEREVQIVKSMISVEMSAQERNPYFVARRFMLRLLFQGHPYEQLFFPRETSKAWTARNLQEFWDRYIGPNNSQIIVTGDLTVNTVVRKVSHVLNTWRPTAAKTGIIPSPRPPALDRVCFIEVPQAVNCAIYAGTVLPQVVTGERFALLVLHQMLGGSINSRLFMNLRNSKGFAYEAYSRPEFYRAGGVLSLRALVRPEELAASVRELLATARGLTKEAPAQREIDEAKSILLGSFPRQIDRFDDYSGSVSTLLASGAGEELWARFPEFVLDVDAERILLTAQKYLTQPFLIVIAGSREQCWEALSEFETVEIYDAKGQLKSTNRKQRSP